MGVYVLHFEPPFQHARHYVGFTVDPTPDRRLREHIKGQGSPLVYAAHQAGCTITVVKWWKSGCRNFERWIKNKGGAVRWCKCCKVCSRRHPTIAQYRRQKSAKTRK